MKIEELRTQIKGAGIAGAGGAGFPSYAKLSEGIDVLLVNGSECEPLLYTDCFLLMKQLPEVISGIRAILEGTGIGRAMLCVKEHTAKRLFLAEGDKLAENITLKTLPNVYPVGDEVSLIYEATGRTVKAGNLPASAGVLVYNAETVYNIARAARGEPVTEKWLTVGGDVPEATVLKVPVGTPVSRLFEILNIRIPEDRVVLDGGPSMGKIINYRQAVVTKTTKGVLVLPEETEAVRMKQMDAEMSVARAETGCCQCTHCTDVCPRALIGYPIEPHKLVRTAKGAVEIDPALALTATLCCGCGLCTALACCQGVSPKAVIDRYKAQLAAKKLKFVAAAEPKVSPEREYRMIPVERWARALGVRKFDKMPVFRDTVEVSRVEIPLRQHIGAKSVPIVKDGETVEKGQPIADCAEGLSLRQHASIAGRARLYEDKIVIEKS